MADANNAVESPSRNAAARPRPSYPFNIGCLVAVTASAGLLLTFFIAFGFAVDQNYMSWPTRRNLSNVIAALRHYHDDYGSFPPAVVTDASGKPLYSWRVLLVPYLRDPDVRDIPPFDLSQAWDSEANRGASAYRLSSFDTPRRQGQCAIYALVGKNTMFPPNGCRKLSEVTDDPAQTMVLVSVFGRTQSWAAPGDVNIDERPVVGRTIHIPNSQYWAGSQAAFLDGEAMRLPRTTTDNRLRFAASIAGGESLDLQRGR